MIKKALMWVGGISLGIWAAKAIGKGFAKGIQVQPKDAQVDLSNFPATLRIRWNMEISNTTGITATIYSLDGEVFYGTNKLADASVANAVTLVAGEKRIVPFILDIPVIQVLGDLIANAITSGGMSLLGKIRFKGLIKTSALNIPIDMFIPIVQ